VIWPAEKFFWTVAEAPGIKPGPLPAGLCPALEDDAPVPAESLWPVVTPIDAERVLVCAVRRSDLTDLDPRTLKLTPESLPDFVGSAILPDQLNLLIGEFEPRSLRRHRIRSQARTAAAALVCIALVAIGLVRRTSAWSDDATASQAAAHALVQSLAPSLGWSDADLVLELQTRRQAVPQDLKAPGDASASIAALIGRWPTQVPARPQGLLVTGDSASVSVTVPGDPAAFLSALKAPEGWTLQEPRLAAVDRATRLTLEFRRNHP
jgi:hypothetical protein